MHSMQLRSSYSHGAPLSLQVPPQLRQRRATADRAVQPLQKRWPAAPTHSLGTPLKETYRKPDKLKP